MPLLAFLLLPTLEKGQNKTITLITDANFCVPLQNTLPVYTLRWGGTTYFHTQNARLAKNRSRAIGSSLNTSTKCSLKFKSFQYDLIDSKQQEKNKKPPNVKIANLTLLLCKLNTNIRRNYYRISLPRTIQTLFFRRVEKATV